MTKQKMSFAVDDIQVINDNIDKSQFSLLSVDCFATGRSAHDTFVTEETLKRTAKTILQKPFVFAIDERFDDLGTHQSNEVAGGFVPHDSPITFRQLDDGRTMMNCQVLIWKRYSGKLLEYFSRDGNKKSVSVEIEVLDSRDDIKSGLTELLDYVFNAITGLGDLIQSAIPNAEAVLQFAQEFEKDKEDYLFSDKYSDLNFLIPSNIKRNAQKALDEYSTGKNKSTSVALANARFLVKNDKISHDRIRQMSKFFNRKVDMDDMALGLYGGKQAKKWVSDLMSQIQEIDDKRMSYFDAGEEGGEVMPYSSLKDINPSLKGIEPPITLSQANAIAKQADAVGADKGGWGIAIKHFKDSHEVKDGHWVAKHMSTFDERGELEFAKEDLGKGESLKIDKSKDAMSESPWGNVDKTSLRNKILSASNYKSLIKDVYALVEEGWEDHPSSSLKYPIMEIKDGTLVYNRYGLSAALQRAEGQSESGVVSKVHGIYEKMGLDKPEKMSDENNEEMEDINMAKAKEDKAKEEEKETPEEEKAESPEEEKKEKDEGTEKKFSLDAYVDVMAALGFLKNTTDVNEEMASKMKMAADEVEKFAADESEDKELDYGKVMAGMYAVMCNAKEVMGRMAKDAEVYMAENSELKKFKADMEDKQKQFAVDSTLKELSDKVVIPETVMTEMRDSSKNFSLDTIEAWKNNCKAKVFEFAVKENSDKGDGLMRYGLHNLFDVAKKSEDVWQTLSEKNK